MDLSLIHLVTSLVGPSAILGFLQTMSCLASHRGAGALGECGWKGGTIWVPFWAQILIAMAPALPNILLRHFCVVEEKGHPSHRSRSMKGQRESQQNARTGLMGSFVTCFSESTENETKLSLSWPLRHFDVCG